MAATSLNADDLQSAFDVFNRQSGILEQSYRRLQQRVELLTEQLKLAQSERLTELVAKERLSQRLAHIIDSMPGAIVIIDDDGVIQDRNTEAQSLLDQPLIGCAWSQVVQREASSAGCEDGNIELLDGRCLSLSRRPLDGGHGEVLLLADITESRRMAEIRERQDRLTEIGEMTARFAHQVRTPLASAMLYTAQLDRNTDKQRRVAARISSRLDDLGRMVNDMLGFAAGARQAEEPVGLYDLLTDVQLSLEGQFGGPVDIRVAVADATLQVPANRDALKGALLNLVTNAIQASDASGTIALSALRAGDKIEISVADDGPGIDPETLPRLFEPFFTTRPQGTGLGLAVVMAVAKAHLGDVRVQTSPHGTCFSILLPVSSPCRESDHE